ncbi:MAG: hypothetical protein ACOVO0_05840 [Burkholderiaceae bacterium]
MNSHTEQRLLAMIKSLSPKHLAQVETFVDFLTHQANKAAALDRLLAIAPALEAAGAPVMSDEEVSALVIAEIKEACRIRAGKELRAMWEQFPREELTPEIEEEIADVVRAVRAERRKRDASANATQVDDKPPQPDHDDHSN